MSRPDDDQDRRLARCPQHLRPALRACSDAQTPPNVALLRVLMNAHDAQEAYAALREAHDGSHDSHERDRLSLVLALWRDNPQAFGLVKCVLSELEHQRTASTIDEGVSDWAAAFDRMSGLAQEGGVALYAFGNPDLLHDATAEIVNRLQSWGLLGPDRTALDLGCGIGRITAALAPAVEHVTGIDISKSMIARAAERCSGSPNVTLRVSSGRDLADFDGDSFDLVLVADVFPYLVLTGASLVAAHVAEAARVLKPGGSLVILNMSYRDDPERDLAEVTALAEGSGLTLTRHGTRDFAHWDGVTFQLTKDRAA
jgi:ubiquinone/menaquinone biosynthesis C-methylase UbiE